MYARTPNAGDIRASDKSWKIVVGTCSLVVVGIAFLL